jgi:hypothetical protein
LEREELVEVERASKGGKVRKWWSGGDGVGSQGNKFIAD